MRSRECVVLINCVRYTEKSYSEGEDETRRVYSAFG